jgi:hypothetical protein
MKIRQTRRGQTVVLFSLAIVPLLGMMALVVDVGWAYFRKEAAQTASDAAASAAAEAAYAAAGGGAPTCGTPKVACYASEYTCPSSLSGTPADNIIAGCMYAKENGFISTGKQAVTFQSGTGAAPTSSGVTVAYWIVVRVKEQVPQFFGTPLTVVARSTTGTRVGSSGGCVITLNPTASGAITMTGTTNLTTGCGVFDNSNASDAVSIVGGGTITTTGTAKTDIVGNWSGSGNINPAPRTGVPYMGDPFADLAPPTDNGCSAGYASGIALGSHDTASITSSTTTPTVICNGINLSSHADLSLGPGLYIVRGGISLGGQSHISGTGVTIYIESGGVSMAGGSAADLTAPSSGPWQGILFYQDRGDATASTLVGGTAQSLTGVLYFPKAALTFTGGSSTTANQTTIVSDTLSLVGNSYISTAASTAFTGTTGGVVMVE